MARITAPCWLHVAPVAHLGHAEDPLEARFAVVDRAASGHRRRRRPLDLNVNATLTTGTRDPLPEQMNQNNHPSAVLEPRCSRREGFEAPGP